MPPKLGMNTLGSKSKLLRRLKIKIILISRNVVSVRRLRVMPGNIKCVLLASKHFIAVPIARSITGVKVIGRSARNFKAKQNEE